jgi:hypothetical protein
LCEHHHIKSSSSKDNKRKAKNDYITFYQYNVLKTKREDEKHEANFFKSPHSLLCDLDLRKCVVVACSILEFMPLTIILLFCINLLVFMGKSPDDPKLFLPEIELEFSQTVRPKGSSLTT